MEKNKRISRRSWIRVAATMVATVAACPFVGAAAHAATRKKIAKAVVHYQDHPSGHKMCGMCIHFIPTGGVAGHGMMGGMGPGMMRDMPNMGPGMMKDGTCQLVEGRISPMGYCILYAPVRTVDS
ncbi:MULTISPECIES: hypothetical protein [Acidithiobacillus]|jgi:hypothetical protein|uniref:High potential iron-sulfur proteins family profile domain-containing protein n=2 Tax=Acidithiobacillus TaxID=119977 RepID=A0A179BI25_ACIFR|nr:MULTISPECIES: hypothetical protein [Acidithiobacillus]MDA8181281.1 hypothetical protein [Acidithiobacillus sp.]MEB8486974.1 hypothetical protein [Acidithiobacillus ferriphilus]MEB8491281.1 hypothetical protein [Acidithiobacillus ferriphilus]MEB8494591.1 hypothetical protein [Acidithiobacillus ferriphilus]MEB8512495.1 hypothetical protein [Acidithiobacillus ferriphilus]